MTNQIKAMMLGIVVVLAFLIIPESKAADPIVTNATSDSKVTNTTNTTTRIKTNPPSAISPSINASNSDLCTVGVSGAVQASIVGISTGQAYTDASCSRRKDAKILYDMGMKVAAVSMMCQDYATYDAMLKAGTPCPYAGKIGEEAEELWKKNPKQIPEKVNVKSFDRDAFLEKLMGGILGVILLAILAM